MKRFIIVVLVFVIIGVGVYWWYRSSGTNQPNAGVSSYPTTVTPAISINAQLTPRETAVNFFQACAVGDWSQASTYCSYVNQLKDQLDGMQVIKIGEPFKKIPGYAGLHVPYEIKLKSGEIKKYDLAVRNDNPQKVWQVDGGL